MTHITTVSGRCVDPREDMPDFSINDIAHSLARIVRYNGHQNWTWTVAQHSICCAHLVIDPAFAREALLHDATEAYLCDIPTPIKRMLPDYMALEARLDRAFRRWADLPMVMSAEVQAVDYEMFITEASVLHPKLYEELGKPEVHPHALDLFNRYAHLGTSHIESIFKDMADAR